jgi:hypothetical protein
METKILEKKNINIVNNDNTDLKNYKILNKKVKRISKTFKSNNSKKKSPDSSENINELIKYESNPVNIGFCRDIIKDSYACDTGLNDTFALFHSINDIFYLIYSNEQKSIIGYDLIDNIKLIEIKDAHEFYINCFRHFYDKNKKRDLVLSISSWDSNIKVWNINNWECLQNFKKVYIFGELYSACITKDNDKIYIITSNDNMHDKSGPIKVYNLKGKKVKTIKNSNERAFFIDTYYD